MTPHAGSGMEQIVMRQQWHDLLFMHWPVASDSVQKLLPPGLIVNKFQGNAYVGLVPFRMTGVSPALLAPVWGLSDLLECNVRTYVRRVDGTAPGVWFFSLDAAGIVAVAVARAAFALPYFYAKMHQADLREHDPGGRWRRQVSYTTTRMHPGARGGYCRAVYELPGGAVAPAVPGSLDEFLIERYLLYARRADKLYCGRVHHAPYQIEPVELMHLQETLIAAAGIARPDTRPPLVHYSRRVVVEVSPLKPLHD